MNLLYVIKTHNFEIILKLFSKSLNINDFDFDFQNNCFVVILIFKITKLGDFAHLWIPFMVNRGDQLGSCSGLHLLEMLDVYLLNRGSELGSVLKQRSYQCSIQPKHRLLVLVAKHPLDTDQEIQRLKHCAEGTEFLTHNWLRVRGTRMELEILKRCINEY